MTKDFVIISNDALEDIFYFVEDIETLPRSAVGFKYVRSGEAGTEISDYKIGIPVNTPMKLVGNEKVYDINTNGKAEYGLYSEGSDIRLVNVGDNTRLVDNFDDLQAAFFTERTMKNVRGL